MATANPFQRAYRSTSNLMTVWRVKIIYKKDCLSWKPGEPFYFWNQSICRAVARFGGGNRGNPTTFTVTGRLGYWRD